MRLIMFYICVLFCLTSCSRSSTKKTFALKKDDFTFYNSKNDSAYEKLKKYPIAVYAFGTCSERVLYKGLYVDEYTTDCNNPSQFIEETFLMFLDSNRVYYYSQGRKSRILSIENNNLSSGQTNIDKVDLLSGDNYAKAASERISILKSGNRPEEIKIELNPEIADYQRRGYYNVRKCPSSGINADSLKISQIDIKGIIGNRLPATGQGENVRNYKPSGYCLDIELERPINLRKAKKAKRKIADAKLQTSIPYSLPPSKEIIKKKDKDEMIAKYADKIYMGFLILEEENIDPKKYVLKLEYLTKPDNRSRIWGAAESRTIFTSQTFREQVVFYPRAKKNLTVLINDKLYSKEKEALLSNLNW